MIRFLAFSLLTAFSWAQLVSLTDATFLGMNGLVYEVEFDLEEDGSEENGEKEETSKQKIVPANRAVFNGQSLILQATLTSDFRPRGGHFLDVPVPPPEV